MIAPPTVVDSDPAAVLARLVGSYAVDTGAAPLAGSPELQLLQTSAYGLALLRAEIDRAAAQGLLAFATGGALDAVAALYGVERLDGEADGALRGRARAALATLGAAGTPESWRAHALAAHPEVAVVVAYAPPGDGGDVRVVVAGAAGADLSDEALAAVDARLQADDVRQLCAVVEVVRPTPVDVDLDVLYHVRAGYRSETARIAAEVAVAVDAYAAYVSARPGTDVLHDEVKGRVMAVEGVRRVDVLAPPELVVENDEVARVTNVSVRFGAVEEP